MGDKTQTEAWLKEKDINFVTVSHDLVKTIPEMLEKVHFTGDVEHAKFAKNLFLYDKKKKERMWLVICAHDTQFQMKSLEKHWKTGSGNLRGGNAELMESILGVKAGAVNLFSIVNDADKKVTLVMDKRLMEEFEHVAYHPMQSDFTTAISKADQSKIIELSGHTPEVLDFSTLESTVTAAAPAKQQKGPKGAKKGNEEKKQQPKKKDEHKKEDVHKLGIEFAKECHFSQWYAQVITKAELIEYYEISGCYILRPNAFYIWEQIQAFFDARIKSIGVQNAYFPMFVSEAALKKEEKHLEGFSPEVAWVTKSGSSDLAEPIAIRPTSETIMYPAYAKWIHSWRDLPMMLNQWTNVVRWEFKHPTPFIRTREFLWQEGHTAHETRDQAVDQVNKILDFYAEVYEELLAVPVVKGRKSEDERFAGADNTTTVELYVPVSGRGIQGATSHMLGQNFSKMFNVSFEDRNEQKQLVWQTSWGLSTRSIGSMIMIHSDNKGLVLPPKVAQIQIVIVPIIFKGDDHKAFNEKAWELKQALTKKGLRVHVDDRENHNPGFKFNAWELKGVPVRLELGGKDMKNQEVKAVIRHSGQKFQAKWETLDEEMHALMDTLHKEMFEKARQAREDHLKHVNNWEDFLACLNKKDICLAPWCDRKCCEEKIKDESKEASLAYMEETGEADILTGSAKTLCIPHSLGKQDFAEDDDTRCFYCGEKAKVTALWGRSY